MLSHVNHMPITCLITLIQPTVELSHIRNVSQVNHMPITWLIASNSGAITCHISATIKCVMVQALTHVHNGEQANKWTSRLIISESKKQLLWDRPHTVSFGMHEEGREGGRGREGGGRERQTDRQTDRQRETQRETQRERQRQRQRNRKTKTKRHCTYHTSSPHQTILSSFSHKEDR